jgi:uncharacterized protein (DUF1778 family)
MSDPQISAIISHDTKSLFEAYARAHGVKKGWVIEQALLQYLNAAAELPADVLLPPRIVLDEASGARFIQRVTGPGRPTDGLRDLMAGRLPDFDG